jgi:D-alanine-D-alanine ligase
MSINLDPEKPRVLVALGGKSTERSVSIETGKSVAKALESLGYSVGVIDIGTGTLMQTPELEKLEKNPTKLPEALNIPLVDIKRHFELVFIAMHGKFGEDGGLQSLLEYCSIPYTGSDPFASAISMDKKHSKIVLKESGVPVLDHQIVTSPDEKITIPYPIVIKPNDQGSSVGVSICQNEAEGKLGLKLAFDYSNQVMIEPFVEGRELTVLVIDDESLKPKALPVIEIIPSQEHKFFDLKAKYDGSTQEICPAKIGDDLTKKSQDIAVRAFEALGCRHFTRVDMMVDKKNNIYVLEANSIPGLTSESLSPKATKAAGMSYEQFIDHIVKIALKSSNALPRTKSSENPQDRI